MSVAGWIALGVVAWVVIALLVAVLVGRMVRLRDRQVPADPAPTPRGPVEQPRVPRTPEPRRPRG
jgi:hypothetical protein